MLHKTLKQEFEQTRYAAVLTLIDLIPITNTN